MLRSPSLSLPLSQVRRPRINQEIRAREVLLVGEKGGEVLPTEQALTRAQAAELDLVEIVPTASPPVCKILDVGSYLYQMQKKQRKQRKSQKQSEVKVIRIGFRTDTHDLDRQATRGREFLAERHLVKVELIMRGREMTNQEYARQKLQKFVSGLLDAAEVEQAMRKQGNRYNVVLKPRKGGGGERKTER